MASERQKLANRLNARRSTGPRTNEGKALARMNALKHGLTAQKVLMPGEIVEAFEALREALYDEHDPKTTTECELVELIASLFWRLRRIPEFEARLLNPRNSDQVPQTKGVLIYPWDEVPGGPDPDRPDAKPANPKKAALPEDTEQGKPLHILRFPQRAELFDGPTFSRLEQIDRHQTSLLNALIKALHLFSVLQCRK
jgi:hypothetical protein